MSQRTFLTIAFTLSIGFILGFGIPFSIGSTVIVAQYYGSFQMREAKIALFPEGISLMTGMIVLMAYAMGGKTRGRRRHCQGIYQHLCRTHEAYP